MKKRKIIGVLLCMSLVAGLTGCGGKDTNSSSDGNATAKEAASDGSKVADVEVSEGGSLFLQDGLRGLEEKNIDDIMLYDWFTFGQANDFESIIANYDSFGLKTQLYSYTAEGLDDLYHAKEMLGDQKLDNDVQLGSYAVDLSCSKGTGDSREHVFTLSIINCSDSLATIGEIIPQNNWCTESSMSMETVKPVNEALNIDTDASEEEFRQTMADVVAVLGKPTKVYASHFANQTIDDFTTAIKSGIASPGVVYDIVYERENYMVVIQVSEHNYNGSARGYGGSAKIRYYANGMKEKADLYENDVTDLYVD